MNPFKVGDVVYHCILGKGEVKSMDEGAAVYNLFFKGKDAAWTTAAHLSFEPWTKPVHVRPFKPVLQKGQKLVAIRGCAAITNITVEEETEDRVWTTLGNSFHKDVWTFFRPADAIKFN